MVSHLPLSELSTLMAQVGKDPVPIVRPQPVHPEKLPPVSVGGATVVVLPEPAPPPTSKRPRVNRWPVAALGV